MNKDAILKAFGGSEEDFYRLYPTEDHFKKAMGGAFETYTSDVPDFFNPQFIMDRGGNVASPMNYGAFPVMRQGGDMPCFDCGGSHMQAGGPTIPGYDPTTGQHMLSAGQSSLTPAQLTTSGYTQASNNPNWYNQETGRYYKPFSPGQPGYVAPLQNTNTAKSNPLIQKGFPGADTSINTSYTTPIQQVTTGNVFKQRPVLGSKKEGGSADQGLNQDDILKQKKDMFLNFIQNNTQKALMKEMHEEMMGEMMRYGGLPQAQKGYQTSTDPDYDEYLKWKQSQRIPYTQNYNPNTGYTGMNYFPMNTRQTWQPSKKDLATLSSLSKDAKWTGFEANYGLLGRLAPKMFGPKSYTFNFSDVNPATSQHPGVNLLDKNNPLHDPNKDVSTPEQAGSLYRSSQPDGRNMINRAINPYQTMDFGGVPMYQEGSSVLTKQTQPYMSLPAIDLVGPGATQSSQNFSTSTISPVHPSATTLNNIEMKDYGQNPADRINKSVKINRKNEFNGEEAANWLLAGMSNVSNVFEGRDRRAAEERMKALQSGDNQFLSTQGNRGDYDVNTGMFRVDQDVPVQFSGAGLTANNGQTNYQFGGQNDEELELTEEEIAAIEAAGGQVEYLD